MATNAEGTSYICYIPLVLLATTVKTSRKYKIYTAVRLEVFLPGLEKLTAYDTLRIQYMYTIQ